MGTEELDDALADDILDAAKEQYPPKSVRWFADEFDVDPEEVQRYLKGWIDGGWMKAVQDSDGTWVFIGDNVGGFPFETADRVLSDLNQVIFHEDFDEPKQVSWFAEKVDSAQWKTHWALKELEEMDTVKEHTSDRVPLYAPPRVDAVSDTPQLHLTKDDTTRLVLPSGESHEVTISTVGDCTVASSHSSHTAAVFVDDEFSFLIDEDVPVSRVAIGKKGHVAYHVGEHRESVFHLSTWDGEVLLKNTVEVARSPVFTPDGEYVAYWRLTDHTVYVYEVETLTVCGEFDTTALRRTNIGLRGVTRDGDPKFQISDTYGPGDDEVIGYISPTGELLGAETDPGTVETPDEEDPSDEAILDEIITEFEHGL